MAVSPLLKGLLQEELPLEYHSELNPRLWLSDYTLRPDVREKLIDFGRRWARYARIPEDAILEIWMLGGNCNYNWSSFSDIDVHVQVDRAVLGPLLGIYDAEILDDYLKDKKLLWSLNHSPTVASYPLEPYAEDIHSVHPIGQGIYSLTRDTWVIKPVLGNYSWSTDPVLEKKVMEYADDFDRLIEEGAAPNAFDDLWDQIAKKRKEAVDEGGEFAQMNLVFKALRNLGYLDRVTKYMRDYEDRGLSLFDTDS